MFKRLIALFATRRELKRLAADVKYYRGRAEALEASRDYWQKLVLERDMLFVDRYQTAIVKTYATGDAAKANVAPVTANDEARKELLQERYDLERNRLERDAEAAGLPLSAVDIAFAELKPEIAAALDEEFGFNS